MNFVVFDVIATDEFGVFSAATFLQGLKYEHGTNHSGGPNNILVINDETGFPSEIYFIRINYVSIIFPLIFCPPQ
jgi:hypothetical protein